MIKYGDFKETNHSYVQTRLQIRGKMIKERRKKKNLTQEGLARAIEEKLGYPEGIISYKRIYHWEKGAVINIDGDVLEALAAILELAISDIQGTTDFSLSTIPHSAHLDLISEFHSYADKYVPLHASELAKDIEYSKIIKMEVREIFEEFLRTKDSQCKQVE